jgi:prepilin-type N-terminal cleavage/methylation domain-containing protein
LQIENCKLLSDEHRPGRCGFTLVELLVTISILVLLMAVAARTMNFSVEDRRIREAAREITVFFGSARAHAMETGRPCGVMLRRLGSELPMSLCVVGLDQVEVPPPYAGETLNATARLQVTGISGGLATVRAQLSPAINAGLVNKDDRVQLNCQGPLYTISDLSTDDTSLTLQIDVRQGQMLPWPSGGAWSPPVPYQIIRQPQKSAVGGLQLPARAVIDLEFSGAEFPAGQPHFMYEPGEPPGSLVYVMFSPTGSLERIYHSGEMHLGTQPIYLLVGKQERVPAGAAEDGLANWQDVKNLWITLNPQTGMATAAEVAAVDPAVPEPEQGVPLAREIARQGQSMGGR